MTGTVDFKYDSMPSLWRVYPRVILMPRPTLVPTGETVPRITAAISGVKVDPDNLKQYQVVCGFKQEGVLPLTYPHVLASPLHLDVLTSSAFPVRILGLVHIGNTITQHQPIASDSAIDLRCEIEGHEDTDRGQEFELKTIALDGTTVMWEETSRFLARGPRRRGNRKGRAKRADDSALSNIETTSWQVSADIGRRYAAVSGDFNPIHLSLPTARLLGFPRAIAHGMWSLARSLAEMTTVNPVDSARVEAEFKLPILLPAWVMLRWHTNTGAVDFRLRDAHSEKPHLSGRIVPL